MGKYTVSFVLTFFSSDTHMAHSSVVFRSVLKHNIRDPSWLSKPAPLSLLSSLSCLLFFFLTLTSPQSLTFIHSFIYLYVFPLKCKLHENRNFSMYCSLPSRLWLAHGRRSLFVARMWPNQLPASLSFSLCFPLYTGDLPQFIVSQSCLLLKSPSS